MSTLTSTEREVLVSLDATADLSFREVGKALHIREDTVRRTFDKLCDRGVIRGRTIYVDTPRLGLLEFALFFSVSAAQHPQRYQIEVTLKKSPLVRWLADVGGEADYAVSFLSRDLTQVRTFLDSFSKQFRNPFGFKQTALRSYVARFPRSYLLPNAKHESSIVVGESALPLSRDDFDTQILRQLSTGQFLTTRDIAKRLNQQQSTVARRIRAMKQSGLLLGSTLRIDSAALGVEQYRLLVATRGIGAELRSRMMKFVKANPEVRILVELFGSWDYELEVEVFHRKDLKRIASALTIYLGTDLYSLRTVSIFDHLKYVGLPAV